MQGGHRAGMTGQTGCCPPGQEQPEGIKQGETEGPSLVGGLPLRPFTPWGSPATGHLFQRSGCSYGCWHPDPGAERRPSTCQGLSGSRHGGVLLGTEKLPLPSPHARDFSCGKSCQGAQGLRQPVMGWRR